MTTSNPATSIHFIRKRRRHPAFTATRSAILFCLPGVRYGT